MLRIALDVISCWHYKISQRISKNSIISNLVSILIGKAMSLSMDIWRNGHFHGCLGFKGLLLTILLTLALSIYKYFKWIGKNKTFRKVPCVNDVSHYVM